MSYHRHPTTYGRHPAVRSVGRRLVALAGAGLVGLFVGALLLPGVPAAADTGPLALEVNGDGAHGVNVVVTWKRSGRPVLDPVEMTFTAVSRSGQTFGPVRLVSSPEGQAFYESSRGLPSGTWRVLVTATKPRAAQASVTVVSHDLRTADTSQTPESAKSSGQRGGGVGTLGGIAIAAGAGIVIACSFVLFRAVRRRTPEQDGIGR